MNLWNTLKSILPDRPTLIGTVLAQMPDGTSAVQLMGGRLMVDKGLMRVAGHGVAEGKNCFIRDGLIIGEAPDLKVYECVV
ncbi:MAG: hypothetical protein WC091_11785 [Sulfuricellaceae bacterium]